jgi:hypothetical protein
MITQHHVSMLCECVFEYVALCECVECSLEQLVPWLEVVLHKRLIMQKRKDDVPRVL